jgi:hypothetical protein
VQDEPVEQQGRVGSQATPSRTHWAPQNPSLHDWFEQHRLTEEQSAPSGMHAGCGLTQTPLEQTRSEQQGVLASQALANSWQAPASGWGAPPQMPRPWRAST